MINFQIVKNIGMEIENGVFGNDWEIASPATRDRNDRQANKIGV
jgi:hypothetical protein